MRLLLDTNALIWWLEDNPRLGQRARTIIADSSTDVLTSIVCLWEIAIKWRVGKMQAPATPFASMLAEQDVALLSIEAAHIRTLESLPFHHGDPYDHMIIAQAKSEGAAIMTNDRQFSGYGIPCIGVA